MKNQSPKRIIGISFSRTNFHYYWDWFTAQDLGEDVELRLLSFEQANTEDFALCDAFVLTGGVDIHPALYGGSEDYANRPEAFEPDRDRFETMLYRHAQRNFKPVLAICRGMQLVYVLHGGKLAQDLGEKNTVHRKEAGADKEHTVQVSPPSLLYEIVGVEDGTVNSAHHQATSDPWLSGTWHIASGCASKDGVIESIEHMQWDKAPFMLGVQWHPERMADQQSPFSKNIKGRFLKETRTLNRNKLAVINPANEEVITHLTEDNDETLSRKLKTLRWGGEKWREVSLPERVRILQRFSELLNENTEALAAVLTSEVGKPLQQARNEINGARTRIAWLTSNAEKYLSEETMTDEAGLQEKIAYEPLGAVCNISAWNYPYLVGVNVFVPALLAGNSVLYKPSEFASLTGLQIEKWLKEAGVPDDVFQIAIGGREVGEKLLDLPLDGYYFTGSAKTGKHIYERVAPKMVPCQCELGGKDPLYVADDVADIKAVAAATADGAFYNNGQSCCAVERIYVHEKVYDDYLAAFVEEVKAFKIGEPTEDGVYIGSLTREAQVKVLEEQIADALAKGATVLAGGKRLSRGGYYFAPTVLANVNSKMQVMREESFGPVIGIEKVPDDEVAVHLMNDTDYGLTAAVYSNSEERARNILSQLNTGTGYWNCCDRVSAALPWSGRKASGFGSTLSHAGLRAFTKPKAYHLKPPAQS